MATKLIRYETTQGPVVRKEWEPDDYKPTFWESPQRVTRFYNTIRSRPPEWQAPEWLDRQGVEAAYRYFKEANRGRSPNQWQYLQPDDPARSFLQSLPVPQPEALWRDEFRFLNQVPPEAYAPPRAPGPRPTPLSALTDEELPGWQRVMISIMGSPATSAAITAVPGAMIGAAFGGLPGAAIGAGIGGGAGYYAGQNPEGTLARWLMYLDYPREWLEKGVGTFTQLAAAGLEPQHYGSVDEVLKNLPAAWDAATLTYTSLPMEILNVAPWLEEKFTGRPTERAGPGQVWHLGVASPVDIENAAPMAAIVEARRRIMAGEAPQSVYDDITERYGFSGLFRELVSGFVADPLNILPAAESGVGKAVARITKNKALEEAFRTAPGIFQAGQQYKILIRTGRAGKTVDELTAFDRIIGGVTKAGELAELAQDDVGKLQGAFNKITGGMDSTSKARYMLELASDNSGVLLTMAGDDPHEMVRLIRSWANAPVEAAAETGMVFLGAPEGYTVSLAIRDFAKAADDMLLTWDTTAPNRELLLRLGRVLGEEPARVLDDLAKADNAENLFARVMQRAQEGGDVGRVLAEEAQAGRFTPDVLKKMLAVFEGDDAIPWHPREFRANLHASLIEHAADWAVRAYGVKSQAAVMRLSNTLKSAQSLVLLGLNPGYFVNNQVNNMVTRVAAGVFGYMSPRNIERWLDRFGVEPYRLRAGLGAAEVGIDVATDVAAKGEKVIRKAVQPETRGAIDAAQSVLKSANEKLGIFSRLSATFEKLESTQGFSIGMRQAWSRLWRRDKGFQRMPQQLEQALAQVDRRLPDVVYGLVEAGMNQDEIARSLLSTEPIQRSLYSQVDEVARAVGMDPANAREALETTGVWDFIDDGLQQAKTPEEKIAVFDRAERKAQQHIDDLLTEQIKARAEDAANQVKMEGYAPVVKVWDDLQLQISELWNRHFVEWENAFEQASKIENAAQRRNIIVSQRARAAAEWERAWKFQEATHLGIMDGLGFQGERSQTIVKNLVQNADNWKEFFRIRDQKIDEFFNTVFTDRGRRTAMWEGLQDELGELYRRHSVEEVRLQGQMDTAFSGAFEEQFGAQYGVAAGKWRENMLGFYQERAGLMNRFRESIKGQPAEVRRREWTRFLNEEYLPFLRSFFQEQINGAHELYGLTSGQIPIPEVPPMQTPGGGAATGQVGPVSSELQAARILANQSNVGGIWTKDRLRSVGIGDQVIDDLISRGIFKEGVFGDQSTIRIEGLADEINRVRGASTPPPPTEPVAPAQPRAAPAPEPPAAPPPPVEFRPTAAWQEISPDVPIPPGLEIRMDLESGRSFARLQPQAQPGEPPTMGAIRRIAQEVGDIPTIDESGRVIPGADIHIYRAVKAYGGEQAAGYQHMWDMEPEVVRSALLKRKEAQAKKATYQLAEQQRVEAARNAGLMGPRDKLPPEMSEAVMLEARTMLDELLSGEPGRRVIDPETGKFSHAIGTTNPDWYRDLFDAHKVNRKTVIRALERIIEGEGKDVIRKNETTIERVKAILIERVVGERAGQWEQSMPEPKLLLALGDEEQAARALGKYLEDPNWGPVATDEMWADITGSVENFERLLERWFEINTAEAGVELPPPASTVDVTSVPPEAQRAMQQVFNEEMINRFTEDARYDVTGQGERRTMRDLRKEVDRLIAENAKLKMDQELEIPLYVHFRDQVNAAPSKLAVDVQGLKYLNDTFGYESGNQLLRAFVDVAKEQGMEVYRVGGDEFIIPFQNAEEAAAAGQRLQAAFREAIIVAEDANGQKHLYTGFDIYSGVGDDFGRAYAGIDEQKRAYYAIHKRGEAPANARRVEDISGGVAGSEAVQPAEKIAGQAVTDWFDTDGGERRIVQSGDRLGAQDPEGTGRWLEPLPDDPPASGPMPPGTVEQTAGPQYSWMQEQDAWANHVRPLLDALKERAMQPEEVFKLADLDPVSQQSMKKWLRQVEGDMATTKLATIRWGENRRDAALLNYSKRYGIDNYLGLVWPYQFWYTRSMLQWAIRAIDRPAWFSNYSRIRNTMRSAVQMPGFPARLQNRFRVPMPFLPEWAGGGAWVDPLRKFFPFEELTDQIEQRVREKEQIERRAEFLMVRMLQEEEIDQAEFQEGLSRQGAVWERALSQARVENNAEQSNPMDFMSLLTSPALWWTIPMNLLAGEPEKIGPLPVTRTGQALRESAKNIPLVGGMLSGLGNLMAWPEERIKEAAGLSEFGEWGDYYIDRQLANMAADGVITSRDAQIAMMERKGPAFEEAKARVGLETALRVPGALPIYAAGQRANPQEILSAMLTGWLPTGLFPEGELKLRGLQTEYNKAREAYNKGDPTALTTFFDENPEYEARLALRKEPEERLRQFLVSEIWDRYAELGGTHKGQVRDQFGDVFQEAFLSKETRSYDAIDVETLAGWAQALQGYAPTTEQTADIDPTALQLAPPGEAAAVDTYRETRNKAFPNWYAVQQRYFGLPPAERKEYLKRFPELQDYWQWNNRYRAENPEILPYILKVDDDGESTNPLAGAPTAVAQQVYQYRVERDDRYGSEIFEIQEAYFALPAGQARKSFLTQVPQLKEYWDWRRQYIQDHPAIEPYVTSQQSSQPQQQQVDVSDFSPPLVRQLLGYYYARQPLGDGARKQLRQRWEAAGRPGDSFDTFLEITLRAIFGR